MHELARRLVQGEGIAEDQKRGFELAKNQELGFIPAFTVLGYCYFYGNLFQKMNKEALNCLGMLPKTVMIATIQYELPMKEKCY